MLGFGQSSRPQAVAFDVIGTLFPLEPLRPRIVALGLPPAALEGWFAAGLRDAFALDVTGDFAPFAKVLEAALDGALAEQGLTAASGDTHALAKGLEQLDARPGAAEAFALAAEAGTPIVALSNGASSSTKALLDRAGLLPRVAHVVSVDEVRLSKPRAEVYLHAARIAGVDRHKLALVAAHGWDVNGAAAAGLVTAYLSAEQPFSPVMRKPDVEGATLPDCVRALLALKP